MKNHINPISNIPFLSHIAHHYLYFLILITLLNLCSLLYSPQSSLYAQPFKSEWAWVGLVDQINPPWMTISGEYQQSVTIRMTAQHQKLREGSLYAYMLINLYAYML